MSFGPKPRSARRARLSALGIGVVLAALSSGARLSAQEIDDATRSAARALAVEGSDLYAAQNFTDAYDRFNRAYQLVHAPTLGIWAARSLVKLGRLVEASERMLVVQREPIAEDAPPEHQKAKADAIVERQALLQRIPTLRVMVAGAAAADVFVTLNGQLLPAALIGVGSPVDPGKLAIKATRGEQIVEANVELGEGETRDVTLTFVAPARAVPAPRPAAKSGTPVTPSPAESAGADTQRTLGYVALGAGGAGLVVSTVFGLLGLSQKSDLDAACPGGRCAPAAYDDLDAYETKKTVSSVGFVAGAVLAGTGAVLLLTAPPSANQSAALPRSGPPRLSLFFGLGRVGVSGALP